MQKENKEFLMQCFFTPDEKARMADEMAQKEQEKQSLQLALKETTAKIKAQLAEVEKTIHKDAANIRDGYEFREVECEVTYNVPARGQKSVLRSDTGETIVMEMTKDEKADLYYNADEPEEDKEEQQ